MAIADSTGHNPPPASVEPLTPPTKECPVHFLGVARGATRRGVELDLLGITTFLALPFYPQSLYGLCSVFAVRADALTSNMTIKVVIRTRRGLELGSWTLNLKRRDDLTPEIAQAELRDDLLKPTVRTAEMQEGPQNLVIGESQSHLLLAFPFPRAFVLEPGPVQVVLITDDADQPIGTISLGFWEPPPFAPGEQERYLADTGRPSAMGMTLNCTSCNTTFRTHVSLEGTRKDFREEEPLSIPISLLPNIWSCRCGSISFATDYLKRGLHDVLRHRRTGLYDTKPLDVMHHFQSTEANAVLAQYFRLIRNDDNEEVVHAFLHQHKDLFWAFLSPVVIRSKPPVLTKKKADFLILSSSGILTLVELEKPQTRLVTEKGNRHSDVQKGLSQIADWRAVVGDYRAALLAELDLPAAKVQDIRFMLIAGRVGSATTQQMSKLRKDFNPDTEFMTFGDLGAAAASVANYGSQSG